MRVQSYKTLARFIQKTENFLLENEVTNNLFWEALGRLIKKPSSPVWGGTVLKDGKIQICAIRNEANYLLLSNGKEDAISQLINYSKRKKWKLNGVSGPSQCSLLFARAWLKGVPDRLEGRRDFLIFESPQKIPAWGGENKNLYSMKVVGHNEWPRARLWALKFAIESVPQLNGSAVVAMAKKMMKKKSLFFIQKNKIETCGMAGFGRESPSHKVINLVYVPDEFRNQKIAQKLILDLLHFAQQEKKKKCILFSDYNAKNNLYQSIGFKMVSNYGERMF